MTVSPELLAVALIAILATMVLLLAAAWRGPTVFDRILAINTFGTKTVLLIAVVGYVAGRPELYLDLALVYALANFTSTVAVLKVMRYGSLATDSRRAPGRRRPPASGTP
ncbi:MAG: monovalent cation/H+ antiporter complex subunit F [Acidobacteriota bacterium]